jgi:hypothetical protein
MYFVYKMHTPLTNFFFSSMGRVAWRNCSKQREVAIMAAPLNGGAAINTGCIFSLSIRRP